MTSPDNSVKDYDALVKTNGKKIRAGGKTFTISNIPSIVSMRFTRLSLGTLRSEEGPDLSGVKLQSLTDVLNSGIPECEWVNPEWVEKNISAEIYDLLVDDLLGPFLEAQEKSQIRNQQRMVDLITPMIQEIVAAEVQKFLPRQNSSRV